jgi:Ca2+-binding EF-hand superfamily protein
LRAILRAVGERRSEAELEAMMAAADHDGDGTIDYMEFRKLMSGA